MNDVKQALIRVLLGIADVLLVPLTFFGGIWLGIARRYGIEKLPLTRSTLFRIGVFPIRDHYYEPQFKFKPVSSFDIRERHLPGIDLNIGGQLEMINRFRFQEELIRLPMRQTKGHDYFYQNNMFGAGDAEYFYSLIRLIKPLRILEIGCGFSTLMARHAIKENQNENRNYKCLHTCIEPYENPWLAETGVELVRQPLEKLPLTDLTCLQSNDILFIDSSHIIRPEGEVLYEFLEILPRLKSGVYVHIHDVFTPFDYPDKWIRQEMRFWNEQYLLEAFLTGNSGYSVIAAMYFLSRQFPEKLAEKFPVFESARHSKPGSFWMMKR